MKLLFITHQFYPNVGGTEANAEFLAQAFHDNGCTVHLITWTKEKGTKRFPYKITRNPGLKALIKAHKWAEVVFENSPVLRLSWPSIFFKKPSVVALNTWISDANGTKSLAARMKYIWLKRASEVIAVSNAIAKNCWPKAKVIENAYNDALFQSNTDWKRRSKTFVFLGRLVSDKGADTAIEMVRKLKEVNANLSGKTCDFNLTVIGSGEDSEKLKTLVKKQSLDGVVEFTGSLSGQTLVDTLNEHKYILIPSRWEEPFGIVALEGMGAGCIPIVSDGGGLPDAVGNAGLVFNRGDIQNMVNIVTNVLTDEILQSNLRNAAGNHLKLHTRAAIADRYLAVISSVVNKIKI